jgi:hypothetical protein
VPSSWMEELHPILEEGEEAKTPWWWLLMRGVQPPSLRRELGSESRPRHVKNHRLGARLLVNGVNNACLKRVE